MWSTSWPGFPEIASEMNGLRDQMNRVYGAGAFGEAAGLQERGFPPVNIWEDDDSISMEAELPGVDMQAVEIFVNGDDQLTLQGERSKPDSGDGTWHRQERSFGTFVRTLQLPKQVDADQVSAEANNGVLTITFSKKDEVKPRRVKVRSAT